MFVFPSEKFGGLICLDIKFPCYSKIGTSNVITVIFFPMRQSLFIFSIAGKFCLAHGLRQLTETLK